MSPPSKDTADDDALGAEGFEMERDPPRPPTNPVTARRWAFAWCAFILLFVAVWAMRGHRLLVRPEWVDALLYLLTSLCTLVALLCVSMAIFRRWSRRIAATCGVYLLVGFLVFAVGTRGYDAFSQPGLIVFWPSEILLYYGHVLKLWPKYDA